MLDQNHLANALQRERLDTIITQMMNSGIYVGLDEFLTKYPINSAEAFRWTLKGENKGQIQRTQWPQA